MRYEIAVATDIAPRTKCCFRPLKRLGGSGKQCHRNALYTVKTDAMPLFPFFAGGRAAPLCLQHMNGLVGSFIVSSVNEVEEVEKRHRRGR